MYSLQASLAERVKKNRPALDSVASRRPLVSPVSSFALPERQKVTISRRSLDGITYERESFLAGLWGRSWQESSGRLFRKIELSIRYVKRFLSHVTPTFTPHKMLYGSIMGGIAFGMVSMAFIAHFLGSGAFARSEAPVSVAVDSVSEMPATPPAIESYDPNQDVFFEYFGQVTKEKYEASIRDMVKGYPIEAMLPYIFSQDRLTAAFLIGIAKKESNWGKRIPVLGGQDCFNYWGYRGIRRMMGSGGHTCFNSRKDAVETVATRLNTLINSEKLDTPEKMIVWKCGFSCQGHSRESVKKWISDVDLYFSQLSDYSEADGK